MLSWFWRRKSHPTPVALMPAPHTPVPAAASGAGRSRTWPHVADAPTARDVHRHGPRDAFVTSGSPTDRRSGAVDARSLEHRLARVAAWQAAAPMTRLTPTELAPASCDAETPRAQDTSHSGSSSPYSGFGDWAHPLSASHASVASAPSNMQHGRRASSSRSVTINFDSLPPAEAQDPNLATFRFDGAHDPDILFAIDVQLPEDHGLKGGRLLAKSAWETAGEH